MLDRTATAVLADSLHARLTDPLVIDRAPRRIARSLELSINLEAAQDANALIRVADPAMYRIKSGCQRGGRSSIRRPALPVRCEDQAG